MDQRQREYLELQFSPSKWNSRMSPDDIIQHYIQKTSQGAVFTREAELKRTIKSKEAIKSLKGQLNIPYGEKKAQVDIFEPNGYDSLPVHEGKGLNPVMLFIHGGYWKQCSKNEHSHFAVPITKAGGIAVVVGYNLIPTVTMDEIVLEIKSAVEFVAERYPHSSLFLSGHSAGAHLCAMMLALEWPNQEIPNRIKGMCLTSGLFDLSPIVKMRVNEALKMTEDCAVRNSPQHLLRGGAPTLPGCRVVRAAVGEHESPEFHKQSQEFVETLKKHGIESSLMKIPGEDHFSLVENLGQAEFPLAKLMCGLMFGRG